MMEDLPPSYGSLFNEHSSGMSYIDFLPGCIKKGFFSKSKYDTFGAVIDCANEWLRLNPGWQINTCESIEFKDKDGAIYPSKMSYFENTRYQTKYIRGLRLWLRILPSGQERVRKIGYANLVPEAVSQGGVFSNAKYETLDDLLMRFNNSSRMSPLPGRIITIETQGMKIKSGGVIDPDRSNWSEYGEYDNRFIYVIRIFYEIGEPLSEEIGMTDFIPDVTAVDCCSSQYEDFPTLFNKASQWCSRQSSLKICNMQSLSIKVQNEINTRKMSYTEHEKHGTPFVRILRVAHIRCSYRDHSGPIQLSCKSFVPVQRGQSSLFGSPTFEILQEVMQRLSNWIQAANADVLNMETTAVRLSSRGPHHSCNKTYYYDSGHRECYIFIIRAYLKGTYNEPVI